MKYLGFVFLGLFSFSFSAMAECRIDQSFGGATHFLVNGLINKGVPVVRFNVPYEQVGQGAVAVSELENKGGNKTLDDHVRYRLRVKNSSSDPVAFLSDSSSPLSCTNCASAVSIPFSSIYWTEGSAIETRGSSPGISRFNGGEQLWFVGGDNTDSVFNLKYFFDNDTIYPAGTYRGTLTTIGRPQ